MAGGVEVPFLQQLAIEEFLDQLEQWDFTELLFQPLRNDYGKDVDSVNWDILNAGNRTSSGSGATTTGAVATEQEQYLPLQHTHLVRLPLVHLQIDTVSVHINGRLVIGSLSSTFRYEYGADW